MPDTLTPIDKARTALVLMDFQPGGLGMFPDSETLLARAGDALAWARKTQIQVCFVRVAFTEQDHRAIPPHNKTFAPVGQHKLFGARTPETQVHPSLDMREGDLVVRKTRVGAFSTTDLHTRLRTRGIDTLILAGIATSGAVLSTLRYAADADYRTFVLADVTADPDAEVHQILTEKVFPTQADVITVPDLTALSV
ncbi:cysteine hydrolase family protein [Streptomyces sp. enrichment culture]|uniref:cysteine hydrolase family protein n=1 Tax=Streptomyces sp. enrichment culture TaxID=1795815 RepID=UPI003F55A68D